ncbi:hypothetical protein DL98DRAFT_256383 [Cadophora sp. DSE1049]|nr:hypothetical protein DL98DRAFT_256383 [Cadophora sp. DSE1049]
MRHFARCMEDTYEKFVDTVDCFDRDLYPLANSEVNSAMWTENFHSAIYKMLLAGAALTTAHLSPFTVAAAESPSVFLKDFTFVPVEKGYEHDGAGEDELWQEFPRPLSDKELEYLSRFPAYNFQSDKGWRAALGPFSEWAIEDRRKWQEAQGEASDQEPAYHDLLFDKENWKHPRNIDALRDILRLLAVHHHLSGGWIKDGDSSAGCSKMARERKSRTMTVVFYGTFVLEEISMPIHSPNLSKLRVNPPIDSDEGSLVSRRISGGPNTATSHPSFGSVCYLQATVCQLEGNIAQNGMIFERRDLSIFSYFFRTFFGRDFVGDAFEGHARSPYQGFLREAGIFLPYNKVDSPFYELLG